MPGSRRVNDRIFATFHSGDRFGMVALTPKQQRGFIDEHPGMFTPEAGAWDEPGAQKSIWHRQMKRCSVKR
jgi:hypothetical protein